MNGVWVDHGNDADPVKLKKLGADPYYDIRDPRLNPTYMASVRAKGFRPGVYLCSQGDGWPSASKLTGRQWADWAYQQVQRVAGDGKDVRACLNCETHDPAWLVEMLQRWRAHSPRRETSWALEGGQAGIFTPAAVKLINATGVDVVVELFHGDMRPQAPGTVYEMLRAGFNPARLWAFYDGQRIPYNYKDQLGGLIFTQGRIP